METSERHRPTGSVTTANSLGPEFRYIVLFLWILGCLVLGWIGLTDHGAVAKFYSGAFFLLGSGMLLFYLREESALTTNHLLAQGEVTWYQSGRGASVRYRFVALDGRTYEQKSQIFGRRRFEKGKQIPVLYNPLMPTVSKPLVGFTFYRFKATEAVR